MKVPTIIPKDFEAYHKCCSQEQKCFAILHHKTVGIWLSSCACIYIIMKYIICFFYVFFKESMRTQLETDDSQTPWAWFPQHLTFYPSFCNKGIISGSSNWALCTSFAEHSAQGGGLARHLSSHAEFWSTSVFVPFCRWYQLQYPVVRISSDPVPQLMSVGPAPVNEQP